MRDNLVRIEEHLYENKNHTVRKVYRIYRDSSFVNDSLVYNEKSASQLTKAEKAFPKKTIFHF